MTTATGASNKNTYKFTAREDDGTGLYYYRARYYHTGLGRFASEDPIEYQGGDINLYAYAGNSPVAYFDSSGLVRQLTHDERRTILDLLSKLKNCAKKCKDTAASNALGSLEKLYIYETSDLGKSDGDDKIEEDTSTSIVYRPAGWLLIIPRGIILTILRQNFFTTGRESQATTLLHEGYHLWSRDFTEDVSYQFASDHFNILKGCVEK